MFYTARVIPRVKALARSRKLIKISLLYFEFIRSEFIVSKKQLLCNTQLVTYYFVYLNLKKIKIDWAGGFLVYVP